MTAPATDPSCERHGCKHQLSGHPVADEPERDSSVLASTVTLPRRPCSLCRCPNFSGWSGQRGRQGADRG